MYRKILFFLFLLITSYQLPITPVFATPKKISDPFIGVNAKDIIFVPDEATEEDFETIKKNIAQNLDWLANCQGTVVRLFVEPTSSAKKLAALDYALRYGANKGIKFIITLSDSAIISLWPGYHGFLDSDQAIIYDSHLDNLVNKYKNSNSILAWEIGNEPHCHYNDPPDEFKISCSQELITFVQQKAQRIKDLDPNHAVLIGVEGNDSGTYRIMHQDPNINALTTHAYNVDSITHTDSSGQSIGNLHILDNIQTSQELGKPHIFEEYNTLDSANRLSAIENIIKQYFNDYHGTGFLLWHLTLPYYHDSRPGHDLSFTTDNGGAICQIIKNYAPSKPLRYPFTISDPHTGFINRFFQSLTDFLKLVIQNPRRRTATDFGGDPNITTLNSDIGQTITCAYQTDISQDFDPDQFADQLDPNVSVTINGQVHLGDKYSNTSNSNAVNIYYSSRSLDGSDFNTFNPGNSINERMLSQDLLHDLRYQNLILSAYSHSPDPNLNTQGVTDDPVGFSCPQSNHTCLPAKEYSTLAEDIQKTCRPIYATEIVYSQKVPFYTSDSYQTLTPVNLPPDALDLINQFYPNSYNSQHPDTPFSLINTPNDCYHLLYNQMSLANINSIETYYTITDDSSQPKQANRAIPAGIYTNQAIIKSSGMNIPQDLQDDVDIDPDQFCHRLSQSITNPDQLQDIKIPVQKRGLFDFLKKKATSPVTIQLSLPLTYAQQLQKEWARNSMFIPQELSVTNQACSSTNSDATDTGLCTSESQQRVRDMLTPEDWHQTKQL